MFSLKNVSKQFGDEYALRGVTLDIGRGLYFITGASGSGKTTLLKILSGMEEGFQGEAYFGGENLKALTPQQKSNLWGNTFGFVWQDFHLLDECTVLENVLLPQYVGQGTDKKSAERVLRELKINGLANQKVRTLSGGQKQRVAIARELMKNPQVIFADEPTSALDAESAKAIMNLLRTIAKNRTVIVVTHDTSLIDSRAKVLELDKGEVVSALVCKDAPVKIAQKSGSKFSLSGACSLSFTTNIRQPGRVAASVLSMLLSAALLLVSVSGAVSDNGGEAFDKLFASYGDSLLDISIAQSFMSAGGTDGSESDEPNANVDQNIDGLFETYQEDSRVDYVLFAQAFGDIKVSVGGKEIPVETSNNMPVMNRLITGTMPMGTQNQVAVPESLVKKLGLDNEEILGKELIFDGTVNNWENDSLSVTPVSVRAEISGVINSDMITEYEGEMYEYPIDDSFFFSPSALSEMRENAGMKPEPGNFYIRTKTPEDLIAVKDELNAKGIVPLGRFELVEDIVRLNQQTEKQSGSAVAVIGGLSLVIVLAASLMSALLRRQEYAILKVSGFSAAQLTKLMAAEHLMLAAVTSLLFLVCSPLLNMAATTLWNVRLLSGKLLGIGILLILAMTILSLVITASAAACTKVENALRTGDR